MASSEFLVEQISAMAQMFGKTFSRESLKMFISDLGEHSEDELLKSLAKCRKELKFFPSVAEVLSRIDTGHPGIEEAWAMCPKDEFASVVWTDEMAEAFGYCRNLLATDDVAARMTFKEIYPKLVSKSREEKRAVRWMPSLGHDPSLREGTLREAIAKGRLTQEHANRLLPEPISDKKRTQISGPTEQPCPTRFDFSGLLVKIHDNAQNENK